MELDRYLYLVRRHWWILLLSSILIGGATLGLSLLTPAFYQATATLKIDQAGDPRTDPYQALRSGELVAATYVEMITSSPVLREVQGRLGLASGMMDAIRAEHLRDTQLIQVHAEGRDPALAQVLANTTAQVFIDQVARQQKGRFQTNLEELEAQVDSLETAIAETQAELAALGDAENAASEFARLEITRMESQLGRDQTRLVVLLTSAEEFRLAMARYTDDITIFAPAELPLQPVGPHKAQNTLLGAAVGLMLGSLVAFLLEYLDNTIKTPSDVKQYLPTEVLGSLPKLRGNHGVPRLIVAQEPRRPISEAFRNLRTNIEFCRPDRPTRSFLITSPQPTEGKSFVAANVAAAIAQGGRSVILADADLRNAQQHHIFDLPREPGLTDILISWRRKHEDPVEEGEAVWSRVYPELLPQGYYPWALRPTSVPGLRVLTGGRPVINPAELLAYQQMRKLVAWLKDEAEFLVFDTPPVLAAIDAAVLSSVLDGAVLVVDVGGTRLPAATQALERLFKVNRNVLGVVLNRLSAAADGYYYYGHYYENGHGAKDQPIGGRVARLFRPGRHKNENPCRRTGEKR
jgi:Mrp family chromosome partitioning ATPase/capsular polysaccharide biosynthesis protein